MDHLRGYRGKRARLSSSQRLVVFIGSIVLLSGLGLLLGYVVANGLGDHGLDISGTSSASTATAVNQTTPVTAGPGQTAVANQSPTNITGPTVTTTIGIASSPLPQGGAEVTLSPSPDPAFIFTFEGSPAPTPGAASAPVAPQDTVPATISATLSVVATSTIVPAPTETQTVIVATPVAETSPVPTTTPEPAIPATATNPPATATQVVPATNTPAPAPTATHVPPTSTVAAAPAPLPTATATSVPATATPTATAKATPTTASPTATSTTVAPTATATSVSATVAPTATFWATATTVAATPGVTTNTPASHPVLKLEYRTSNSQNTTTEIRPDFNLVNSGPDSILLSDLTIRYWFTEDGNGNQPQDYACDYAVLGCANLTAHFVKLDTPVKGADSYLEIGFVGEVGLLQPGSSTGEIKSRFNKQDWSNYTQSNDYSFDPSKSNFASWKNITLYYKGTLIWGVEPGK